MFRGIKERLDRFAIDLATRTLPRPNPRPNQIGEAREILASPDFLVPPDTPAVLRFLDEHRFTFRSASTLPWEENNQVHGRLFRAGRDWERKPLVLLVHGWNAELQYRYQLPFLARALARRGVNGAMLQLPFHGLRRPRSPGAVRNFISDDVPVMLRATQQALSDLHSFLLWARQVGCSATGVWGFSFGAWLSGLLATASDQLNLAVLTTPVSDMREVISQLPFCEPIRQALRDADLNFSRLNLISRPLKVQPNKVLVIQGEYDLFITTRSLQELRGAWPGAEFWCVPHSHISVLLSWPVFRRTCRWYLHQLQLPPNSSPAP